MALRRSSDDHFMRMVLDLAREALGTTSPNPAVGCVIVRDGGIVGKGATAAGGRPHAETIALARARGRARNATAYVSFEPCSHQGKTPSCARALIEAGVSRVVAGCIDPYPAVRGRGIAILRRAGIRVTVGVLEDECLRVNEGFIARVKSGRPLVTLKLAASLDGRIATPGGDSRWISSAPARELVHRWRAEADAVMVGAGTVIADNPRLTCRPNGKHDLIRDPIRVIIDGKLRVSPRAKVFHPGSGAPTILVTTEANLARARRRFGIARTEVIAAPSANDAIALDALMREFGRRGWCNVLIEGGAHLAGAALRAGIVDRVALFIAPMILGAGIPAIEGLQIGQIRDALLLENLSARRVGDDWLLEGDVRHSGKKMPRR
ncbi:MAG: bifunctional diaminohydroxyphosphoribosylaminopyrimidine deaminase/5-amino-6-(5-phosphoribosylamino)uracil reductase RibD [Candidatus Binatales bacterium]